MNPGLAIVFLFVAFIALVAVVEVMDHRFPRTGVHDAGGGAPAGFFPGPRLRPFPGRPHPMHTKKPRPGCHPDGASEAASGPQLHVTEG